MSELYPTREEYQEILNEIFAHDPELYNYIMYGKYEDSAEFTLEQGRDWEDALEWGAMPPPWL